jgi:menaquinone-specific isochorismate synthase
MDYFIQQSVEKFSDFISQVDLKSNPKITVNYLLSFGVELDSYDFRQNLDRILKSFEKTFYFEKPKDNFAVLGFDDLIVVNTEGKERFATIDKKILSYKSNFLNNWEEIGLENAPVFMGGAKFIPEQPGELWENYSDSYWFIPDNVLLKKGDKYYYLHNIQATNKSDAESLIQRYAAKLKKVTELSAPTPLLPPKILAVKGSSPKEKKKWIASAKEAINMLENADLSKVVLSRSLELKLSEELNLSFALTKLRENYPDSYIFAFHSGKSTFFGASPEKLAKFADNKIEIDAMAGSASRGSSQESDEKLEDDLLHSQKDLAEHKFVLDYIIKSISKIVESLEFDPQPKVKKFKNIQHLWVPLQAALKSGSAVFEVIDTIFPTPAVCGTPKEKAVSCIKKLEDYRRGMYGGMVGWFNFEGEGEFAVSIRSALTKGDKLTAFAGCGIVADSNAEKEYEESELKLKTILSLFENEN